MDLNTSVAVEGQARREVAALVADAAASALFHAPSVAAAERYLRERKFTAAILQVAAARRVEAGRRARAQR